MPAFNVHERRHPLEPVRDRAVEAQHSRAPPVPRAPRAKPRSNSSGALARDTWSRRPGSGPKTSEERRPRIDSPFSHARVSILSRERDAVENQRMEMGPIKRAESCDRNDFKRGHILGRELEANEGMPWSEVSQVVERQAPRDAARRNTLQHELQAAEQGLEWVPKTGAVQAGGRVNALAREVAADEESREWSLGTRAAGRNPTGSDPNYHGRRNVMARESREETCHMPQASGYEGGAVPIYARRQMLARERGLSAPQISCH